MIVVRAIRLRTAAAPKYDAKGNACGPEEPLKGPKISWRIKLWSPNLDIVNVHVQVEEVWLESVRFDQSYPTPELIHSAGRVIPSPADCDSSI
jgi:hypothetical protein